MTEQLPRWSARAGEILASSALDARAALKLCAEIYRSSADQELCTAVSDAVSSLRLALAEPKDAVRATIARRRFWRVRAALDTAFVATSKPRSERTTGVVRAR